MIDGIINSCRNTNVFLPENVEHKSKDGESSRFVRFLGPQLSGNDSQELKHPSNDIKLQLI